MASEEYNTPTEILLWCGYCKKFKSIIEFSRNRARHSGYQNLCKTCNKRHKAAYIEKHRDELNEKNRTYYSIHKKEKRAYYEANIERKKAYDREYLQKNYERIKTKDQAKRARKRGATIETFADLEIFERDAWICQLCHKKVNKRLKYPHSLSASLDHIIPLSKGGSHSRQNCCLAHFRCNNSKQDRSVLQQTRLF